MGLGYIAFALLVPLQDHPPVLTQARLFPLIQNTSEVLLDLVPGTKSGTTARESDGASKKDDSGAAKDGEQTGKTYGVRDRSALDRLIEATGRNQDSSR